MGEQIKIADMARNLIRLSGLVPDEDIKVTFVGLRPGEKLFEELIGARETVQPSPVPKVFEVVGDDAGQAGWLRAEVRRLERAARLGDSNEVVRGLRRIVPEFTGRPWEIAPEMIGKLRARMAGVAVLSPADESSGRTLVVAARRKLNASKRPRRTTSPSPVQYATVVDTTRGDERRARVPAKSASITRPAPVVVGTSAAAPDVAAADKES
jgi:hypothetical protein